MNRMMGMSSIEVSLCRSNELAARSEEHTSELQSQSNLVCRLLLEKKTKSRYSHMHQSSHYQPPLIYAITSPPPSRSPNLASTQIAQILRHTCASTVSELRPTARIP